MRVVLQRVNSASVSVERETIASIGRGVLLLVGVEEGDEAAEAVRFAIKCADMRIFSDAEGKFDASLRDVGGEALVVSQFTLFGDVRRGRRPSFTRAAPPDVAAPIVEAFAEALRGLGIATQTGRFGAHMDVSLVNCGPVTILLDSGELDRPRRGS